MPSRRASSFVEHLACPSCGRTHDHRVARNVCTCGSPLLVEYDLDAMRKQSTREEIAGRAPNMWRYEELLPLDRPSEVVTLGEGLTPMLPVGDRLGLDRVWVKDEGPNPTGTFKARGAACGISRARELGISEVCLPTAGNAGGAWAAYGAAAGVRVHVAMPQTAPEASRIEARIYGADLRLVDGLISDAGRLATAWVRERGCFDVATLREPYRLEGKKTLGLEIVEQLGWSLPDVIVYPAGGGVGLLGIWRGVEQLRRLGWVEGDAPRLVAVQAEGCAPIVRAFEEGRTESTFWEEAATIASGLCVPKSLGDFLVLRAIRETGGTAVAVGDGEILEAVADLARVGLLASPEGAATLAGARRLRERGELHARDRVVLINTGSGLKYPEVLRRVAVETEP